MSNLKNGDVVVGFRDGVTGDITLRHYSRDGVLKNEVPFGSTLPFLPDTPKQIAIYRNNSVYVSESDNAFLAQYDADLNQVWNIVDSSFTILPAGLATKRDVDQVYVSDAQAPFAGSTWKIRLHDTTGAVIDIFENTLPLVASPVSTMSLQRDNCGLLFGIGAAFTAGRCLKYDVCTRSQVPDFGNLGPGFSPALGALALNDGRSVVIANPLPTPAISTITDRALLLDINGNITQRYQETELVQAIAIDPRRNNFWVITRLISGVSKLVRFNITTAIEEVILELNGTIDPVASVEVPAGFFSTTLVGAT